MLSFSRLLPPVCLLAAICSSAYAQSEAELRDMVDGTTVVVRLDMAATQQSLIAFL